MKVNSVNAFYGKSYVQKQNRAFVQNFALQNNNLVSPTFDNIKACFLPSFKGFLPVKETFVFNRETKEPQHALVLKDEIGDFTSFKLYVDGEKDCAGFMNVKNHADYCEIRHLRTLNAGKKYSGIGTALIGCAIDESFYCHKNGEVWVRSHKGYGRELSEYQSGKNPLPFYLKRGFTVLDAKVNEEIKTLFEQNKIDEYPDEILLVLTSEEANKFREKFDKYSVYLQD